MSRVEKITESLRTLMGDILLASLEEKSLSQTQWAKVYSSVEAALFVFLCLGDEGYLCFCGKFNTDDDMCNHSPDDEEEWREENESE